MEKKNIMCMLYSLQIYVEDLNLFVFSQNE